MSNTMNTDNPPRTPFISKQEWTIIRWYAYTAFMTICILAALACAYACMFWTNQTAPMGGWTLIWRIPSAIGFLSSALYLWYRIAEFWDPANVAEIKILGTRIKRALSPGHHYRAFIVHEYNRLYRR